MNKSFKKNIQNKVISLLTSVKKKSLDELAKDSCSEMSRLVGYWILDNNSEVEAFILKGDLLNKKQHDILVVNENNLFSIIDPTIWQFYKKKKTIFLGDFTNLKEVLEFTKKYYSGGTWSISEKLDFTKSKNEQEACISIVKKNLELS